jgi:hypothetical protein
MILFLLAAPPAMFAASVQLSWQPNAEPDLQEYNVYYGTQPRSYGPPIPVDKSATYTLSGLDEGMVYYFAVSAVDNNGNESGFSEEISKTIASIDTQPPTVTITSPVEENTYTTESPTIAIAGTASDDQNLQQVTWINSTGSNGIANSTDNWTIDAVQLVEGANVITVTATDSAGKTAQDSITVTYTAANSTNGVPVVSVASSTDDGNIAANTIDNDLSTRWSASGSGQWIQYDLGSTFSISQALIAYFVGDTRIAEFEIFVSNDASSWNSVFRGQSSGTTLQQESYSIPNAIGRFVRIVGYGNSSNPWNSITEVDIVGVPASTPDTTPPTIIILSPTRSIFLKHQLLVSNWREQPLTTITLPKSPGAIPTAIQARLPEPLIGLLVILTSWKAPIPSPSAPKMLPVIRPQKPLRSSIRLLTLRLLK